MRSDLFQPIEFQTAYSQVIKGIYRLNGDSLTYCLSAPGKPRPKRFVVKKGSGDTLIVLTRIRTDKAGSLAIFTNLGAEEARRAVAAFRAFADAKQAAKEADIKARVVEGVELSQPANQTDITPAANSKGKP